MPSPAGLEQWARRQHENAAADYDAYSHADWQIRLHTQVARRAISAVQRLLQDDIDAPTAAAEFAASWRPHLGDKPGYPIPHGLWRTVCHAIEHFADDEAGSCAKLADLLRELSKIEERRPDGELVTTLDRQIAFWSGLPLLNLAFYDHMNHMLSRGTYADRSDEVLAWSRRLRNVARFLAHWLARYGDSFPRYRPSAMALEHLREALERRHAATAMGRRRAEHYVGAAVHWVGGPAGAQLLQFCRDDYRRDGARPAGARLGGDPGTDGYAFHGDDGFYMERWAGWKAALRRVAATDGLDPVVAANAAAAADEMDRLERSSGHDLPLDEGSLSGDSGAGAWEA